ncbi:MAG: Lrp/AsnC ligand binding domain-containing protein [Bacteroidales bacterium]|nr:Lrp/AsnC ligand binding domain-containing protein [Bacteroidales bacterium]
MEEHVHIDSLDKKILSIIQGNARIPFLEVARECGVSGAAIHQRVQKLMRLGVITGSEFVVDPKKLGFNTCAYIGIYLEKAGLYKEVVAQLKDIPEIVQCDYTTGNYSIFVKVYTRDNLHLKEILADKIQSIRGVARTETFICLEESFVRQLHVL